MTLDYIGQDMRPNSGGSVSITSYSENTNLLLVHVGLEIRQLEPMYQRF